MKMISTIEVESAGGTREVAIAARLLMKRIIFLNDNIDSEMANDFIMKLLYLEASDEPVTIYLNSPGGEVTSGLMIYDAIQGSKLRINIICTGMAASMAAIILAGGQKGRRFILPHSKVMIHEPLIANGIGGSATSVKNISDSILETKSVLNKILSKHTGKTVEEINHATSYDNLMSATEAIKFGICDSIKRSFIV